MRNPLVSIIIPVYNTGQYLSELLDSVINQTYTNWEVLAVDDGSTDNSLEILKEYTAKDDRIHWYHQENQRVAAARNKGLENANGEYIMFSDSDDILEHDLIETAMGYMEKYGDTGVKLIQWEIFFFKDGDRFDKTHKKEKKEHCEILSDYEHCLRIMIDKKGVGNDHNFRMLWNSCRSVCTKLGHRSIFDGVRFPYGKEYEDDYICHKLYKNAGSTLFINDELYNYRRHRNSVLTSMNYYGEKDHKDCDRVRLDECYSTGKSDLISMGAHSYLTAILNLNIKAIKSKLPLEEKENIILLRNEYKRNYKYLSMSDKIVVGFVCAFPYVGGRLFVKYRTIRENI